MDFPVYFYERELDKFLRVLDTNDAEFKDLQTAYATLMTQVKSGFGGALEVVTPELIEEFYFHTETRLEKEDEEDCEVRFVSEGYVQRQEWLTCLCNDLAALGGFFEIKKETEQRERETEDQETEDQETDEEIKSKIRKLQHIISEKQHIISEAKRKLELIEAKRNRVSSDQRKEPIKTLTNTDTSEDDDGADINKLHI